MDGIRIWRAVQLSTLLLVLCPAVSEAQLYPGKIYTISEGLPSNAVYGVTQADDGVMWFVTSKGISTYNAHEWKVFPDSLNLPHSMNSKIHKSEDGTIWVAGKNRDGFVVKYYRNGEWDELFIPQDWDPERVFFTFDVIHRNGAFQFLLAYGHTMYSYSEGDDSWSQVILPDMPNSIHSIQHFDSTTYVNTQNGSLVYEDDQLHYSKTDSLLGSYDQVLIMQKHEDEIYVLGEGWLGIIHNDSTFEVLAENISIGSTLGPNRAYLAVDDKNRIFFSRSSPVMKYDMESGNLQELTIKGRKNDVYSNQIYMDREHNIWSVDNRGLYKFNVLNFRHYNMETGLAGDEVTAIFESKDDTLYVATESYLHTFYNNRMYSPARIPAPGSQYKGRIMDIDQTERGELFLAAGWSGLLKYEKYTNRFERISGGIEYDITSVLNFNSKIFFSSQMALYELRDDGNNYQRVLQQAKYHIRNLANLENEYLAVLTGGDGVYLWSEEEELHFTSGNSNLRNVYDIVRWNGKYIVATVAGLGVLTEQGIEPYPVEGLDEVAFSVLVDSDNHLWIGTFNGIYKWTGQVLDQYTVGNGLIGNEVNRNALIQDSKGYIWIGTELGVSILDKREIMMNKTAPDLRFKSIKADEQSILNSQDASLGYNQNTLAFDFLATSYVYDDKINYRYRLTGLEEEWNETNNFSSTQAVYRNLSPGIYTFRIQAKNQVSEWSEPLIFSFSIQNPFYLQWWFLVLISLLAIALVYILYRIRYFYILRKQNKLKALVEARTQSISRKNQQIQEKNHSLNQALNKLEAAQVELIQKEKMAALGVLTAGVAHEINNPVNYIKSASEIIDALVEEENGKIIISDKETFTQVFASIDIGVDKIVSIVKSLNSFSHSSETDYSECSIHDVLDECLVILHYEYKSRISINKKYSDEPLFTHGNTGKLYQVFTNLLSNAIHSIEANGEITITTKRAEPFLSVEIQDTGQGIEKENMDKIFDPFFTTKDPGTGTGLGLSIVYKIIEEHDGTIAYDSIPGSGTTVTVKLPLTSAGKHEE